MFHKVKRVQALPHMRLNVEFVNGYKKTYDVKPLLGRFDVFNDLTQEGLFKLVRVDVGGHGVIWNDYIDLSCEELWVNGV